MDFGCKHTAVFSCKLVITSPWGTLGCKLWQEQKVTFESASCHQLGRTQRSLQRACEGGLLSQSIQTGCENLICSPEGSFIDERGVMWPLLPIFILQIITIFWSVKQHLTYNRLESSENTKQIQTCSDIEQNPVGERNPFSHPHCVGVSLSLSTHFSWFLLPHHYRWMGSAYLTLALGDGAV